MIVFGFYRKYLFFQDCAGVALFAGENATQVALDAIQCLGNAPH